MKNEDETDLWIEKFIENYLKKHGKLPSDEEISEYMNEADRRAYELAEAELKGN